MTPAGQASSLMPPDVYEPKRGATKHGFSPVDSEICGSGKGQAPVNKNAAIPEVTLQDNQCACLKGFCSPGAW